MYIIYVSLYPSFLANRSPTPIKTPSLSSWSASTLTTTLIWRNRSSKSVKRLAVTLFKFLNKYCSLRLYTCESVYLSESR